MSVTLSDVAKLAGVSPATVSRVVNNDALHPVNKKTAKLVLDAIVALGYSPNEYARNLRRKGPVAKENRALGILLASPIDSYNDPFFYDILLGIQTQVADMGYSLSFTYSLGDTPPDTIQNSLGLNNVSGMILMGRMTAETLHLVEKNVKHVVYAGLNHLDHRFDEVICDGFMCAKTAVHHLAATGHRQIGFIGNAIRGRSSSLVNEYRYDGYLNALEELNLPLRKELVVDTPLNMEMAFQATDAMLCRGVIPDSFFCANDYCAIGALKALRTHRLRVPQDVAVISIDDIEMAAYSQPMLTTVHVPRQEIGKYAAKLLADQITTKRKYAIRVSLPYHLVIRESCGAKPDGAKTQLYRRYP